MSSTLFTPTKLGSLSLKNRIVMAPLKRSRAIGNLPNALLPVNDSNERPIYFVTGH